MIEAMNQAEKRKADDETDRVQRMREQAENSRRRRAIEMVIATDVPHRALVFEPTKQTIALQAVKSLEGSSMIVLAGAPGVGKTVAAAVWLSERVKDRTSWVLERYTDSLDSTSGFGFRWKYGPPCWVSAAALAQVDRYAGGLHRYISAGALVIDDLGAEYADAKGHFAAILDQLINERYASIMPTLITTNLGIEEFKARVGSRIVDRIREGGTFVNCGTLSLRGAAR